MEKGILGVEALAVVTHADAELGVGTGQADVDVGGADMFKCVV